jgi:thiamine pyrophosphate-dependent acetolactate synthase large subunit-like protein
MSAPDRMPLLDALRVLQPLRTDRHAVFTTMAAAREWPKLSAHPLDFHHVPAAMSHTSSLGLGLALARPDLHVWVLNGDGSMLMNLGNLVTAAVHRAANLSLFIIRNDVFEITGGQRIASTDAVDLAAIARAAGFPTTARCANLQQWQSHAATWLAAAGPRCVELIVEPERENYVLPVPPGMAERVEQFRRAVAG